MFHPDGSLRVPDFLQKAKHAEEQRLKGGCICITKNVVSEAPKKCHLYMDLGAGFAKDDFVANIVEHHNFQVETPIRAEKEEGKWKVVVGSDFRRCSDCTKLIRKFRSFADGNLIVKQGTCPYELDHFDKDFLYEDYFE